MKDVEKKYKQLISSVNLSEQEFSIIKRNILTNKKKINYLKLRYAVIIIMLFVSIFGVVSADKIIEHYKIGTSKDAVIKNGTSYISNARIDKDIPKETFKENFYYTYEDIENKLNLKILKNDYYDSDMVVTNFVNSDKGMITKASFTLVNIDKSYISRPSFSFIVKTTHLKENNDFGLTISGPTQYETYYIKNLKTEAIIVKAGSALVEFVYNNLSYEIDYGIVNFSDEKEVNELYGFLESFRID